VTRDTAVDSRGPPRQIGALEYEELSFGKMRGRHELPGPGPRDGPETLERMRRGDGALLPGRRQPDPVAVHARVTSECRWGGKCLRLFASLR